MVAFLPDNLINQATNKLDVSLPLYDLKKQAENALKSASKIEQMVFMHDIIVMHGKIQNKENCLKIAYAAELFIKSAICLDSVFLTHLMDQKELFKNFTTALKANYICHQIYEACGAGLSDLTEELITLEKRLVKIMDKHCVILFNPS